MTTPHFDYKSPYSIGEATVDPSTGQVSLHGSTQRVEPRLMSVLNHLAAHRGQVVSRAELLDAVWKGDESGDESLTQAISGIRSVLGDSPREPTYIQTIPKTGYRLITNPVLGEHQAGASKKTYLLRRGRISKPLFAAVFVVLLVIVGAFSAYFASDPNPDYDMEIEDIDVDFE